MVSHVFEFDAFNFQESLRLLSLVGYERHLSHVRSAFHLRVLFLVACILVLAEAYILRMLSVETIKVLWDLD